MIKMTAGAAAAASLVPRLAGSQPATPERGVRAVAFDAFPIFDPRPIFALVRSVLPEQGEAFGTAWFAKIFAYTWLRTSAGQYADFPTVIDEALRATMASQSVAIGEGDRRLLGEAWFELKPWPDVPEALESLRARGIALAFLSNMSEPMLRTNAARAGLEGHFAHWLSTDIVRAYKPARLAYAMGERAFGMPASSIAFAAFAGWDAAGAAWFGFPTVWVNRLKALPESVEHPAVTTVGDLAEMVEHVATLATVER